MFEHSNVVFCDGRVNQFSLLSLSAPTHKILLSFSPILSCASLMLKEGLEVAHRASLFPASSEVSWADGSLPSVLGTRNLARLWVQQPHLSDRWAGEERRQRSLTSNSIHLCCCSRCLLQEVLPYFRDKVSFIRAMCWTNQVNWEDYNLHWVSLSFLLKADSADRGLILSFLAFPAAS